MAQNETWLTHDLMDAVKVQYLDGNLFSMDNAGNLIGVTLTRDGEDYSGGGSVYANVIRSDGGTVAVIGALSGKTATVVLPQAAYAVPGVVSIIVKLTASGQVTTIAAIVANVYRSSTDTAIDPGTIIPSIQSLISQINTAVASIPADYSALWTKLAPAFSTDASYVAEQYVTYNSGLWRFNTSHSGSWSSSDVTAVNLGGEITDLKSALNFCQESLEYTDKNGYVLTKKETNMTTNDYRLGDDGSKISDSSCKIIDFAVAAGDYVYINSEGNWLFKNNWPVGSQYKVGPVMTGGGIYKVPTTATYVSITSLKNSTETGCYTIVLSKAKEIANAMNEFISPHDYMKKITNKWVVANLSSSGENDYSYNSRALTFNYIRCNESIKIIDESRTLAMIVCLYGDDYSLISRTVYGTDQEVEIPANTNFRLAVYVSANESAISNPFELAKYIVFGKSAYSLSQNEAVKVSRASDLMKRDGKRFLPSEFTIGGLYTDGSIRYEQRTRVVYTDFMSYSEKTRICKDSTDYTMIVCTYNQDRSLKARYVYMSENVANIDANTLFRVCVFNTSNDSSNIEVTDPFEIASHVYIPCYQISLKTDSDYIALFESFAVIGDSLSCGFVSSGGSSYYSSNEARAAGRNWPTYLGMRIDRTFTNLARGSSTAKDWRNGSTSLDVNIETANIDTYCYIVALGVNDIRNGLSVGANSDIKQDADNNSDSFYGNYDWIIRKLKEYKSNRIQQAQIFVLTIPPTESNAEIYNTAIRYIANLYDDVHCIDLYNLYYSEFFKSPLSDLWIGGHSRPLGYMLMSNMIRTAINNYMSDHVSAFAYTPWFPLT